MMSQLSTFLAGLGRGGGALLPALGEGARAVEGSNDTARLLAARGVPTETIQAALTNPAVMQQVIATVFRPQTVKLGQGEALYTNDGRPIASNQPRDQVVAPDATLTRDGVPIYTNTSGRNGAPAGFEWVDPADKSKGLRAIQGGPATQISAEVAGRLALMRRSVPAVENIRGIYERAWDARDLARYAAGNVPYIGDVPQLSGQIGEAQREVRTAIESALRTMTGAAAPEPEVVRYMDLFAPKATDTIESARQKLNNLVGFMQEAENLVTQGRTATPGATNRPGGNRSRTYNPATGALE